MSLYDEPYPVNIADTVKLSRKEAKVYDLEEQAEREEFYDWLDDAVEGERGGYIAVAKRLRIPLDDRDSTYAIAKKIIAQRRRANARSR
jgi:hypothetical protein